MPIEKINFKRPRSTTQSVFLTEEMTALELSAVTAAKVDEMVEAVNGVEQSAIEATAVVDEMRIAQEQFMLENNDIRQELVTDNQDYIDALEASKATFDATMTSDLNTFKSETTADKIAYEAGLNTSKTTFEANMTDMLEDFETSTNASKTTFETNMTNTLNTFTANVNQTVLDIEENANNVLIPDLVADAIADGSLIQPVVNRLDKLYVSVTDAVFGAVGDGVHDDTAAFQAALDTKKKVYIPQGEYKITAPLKIYKGTQLIGREGGSDYYNDGKVKLIFAPTIPQSNMFITEEAPIMEYIFGVTIGGFSVRGEQGGYLFYLPKMCSMYLFDIKQYGGFNYGLLVDGFLDCQIDRCSFQGHYIAGIHAIASYYLTTTTVFTNCYVSQGDKGMIIEEGATNSLVFNSCTFESLNMLADIYTRNNVYFNNLYTENLPKSGNSYMFQIGVNGAKTSTDNNNVTINGGFIEGNIPNIATTKFMNIDYIRNVSVSNVTLQQFQRLFDFTNNLQNLTLVNVSTNFVVHLGNATNDWNKVNTLGGHMPYTLLDSLHDQVFLGVPKLRSYKSNNGTPVGIITPRTIGEEVFDTSTSLWYKSTGYSANDWKQATINPIRTYTTSPITVIVPLYIGEELLDTTNKIWYKSTGLTSDDWITVNEVITYRTNAATPVGAIVPLFVGEELIDTTAKNWYKATGLTNVDWKILT